MNSFGFQVDESSTVRPWEQLRRFIVESIADGRLVDGERLPPVRSLADDVRLAPNTVARAIKELEADGLVVTRGRHGSFVVGRRAGTPSSSIQGLAETFASRARAAGVPPDQAIEAVRRALNNSY